MPTNENESERDTVLAAPPASNTPASPPSPKKATRGGPTNPGVVVLFGKDRNRMARFSSLPVALKEAERQRVRGETLQFYDGADYATELAEGARAGLVVADGQSIEEAQKQARQG